MNLPLIWVAAIMLGGAYLFIAYVAITRSARTYAAMQRAEAAEAKLKTLHNFPSGLADDPQPQYLLPEQYFGRAQKQDYVAMLSSLSAECDELRERVDCLREALARLTDEVKP